MKFGIWTPLPHTIRAEPEMEQAIADTLVQGQHPGHDRALEFACGIVTAAEARGFELTLIAERLLGPDLESWILATALAMRTTRMGVMVAAHPGIVSPQMVAKMGASLDRISGGRFCVNVVNGWWQEEMDLFGNGAWLPDPAARYRRMDEFIRVMKGLWTDGSLESAGEFFHVPNRLLPIRTVQAPAPRIYAASRSDPGKATIAELCDTWFVEYQPDHRAFDANFAAVAADVADMKARAARHGRALEYGVSAHAICAATQAGAEAQAEELERYGAQNRIAQIAAKALGAGLVGTPELIAARLRQYEAIGVDLFMLRFHPMLAGIETFADRVMPLVGMATPLPTPRTAAAAPRLPEWPRTRPSPPR